MNKLEALRNMCNGKIVKSPYGNTFKFNELCELMVINRNGVWQKNNVQFLDYTEFDGWQIDDEPIDGHDWQWAMEHCEPGVEVRCEVRWYEWENKESRLWQNQEGQYCISHMDNMPHVLKMEKKYFTKKGWVLADDLHNADFLDILRDMEGDNIKQKSHRGQKDVHKRLDDLDERNDNIPTPMWLVDKMIDWLELKAGMSLCDPCCGDGRMKNRIFDKYPNFKIDILIDQFDIKGKFDFFAHDMNHNFDRFIMNPPFSNLGAYRFIKRALQFLKPDGRIIAIIPNYILDNADGRKQWLASHLHRLAFIPKDTFKDDGIPVLHGSVVDIRHEENGSFEYFHPGNQDNLFELLI